MTAEAAVYRLPSNDDVAGLGTAPVPARPYYCPEYFALEREAVFERTWLQIGHVSELPEPGCFVVRPVEIARASILLVRGRDGRIRAFHNVCTHRGTQLVDEPSGKRPVFSCRYHGWSFGLDGALRSAPDFERFYVEKSQCGLSRVAVDVCAGLIFINLDRSPALGLREFLGPIAAQLETLHVARATGFSEYVYEIDANWKLTFDNFQENYHLRFIHPRTGEAASSAENPFGYPVHYGFHGPHRTQTIWTNPAAVPKPMQAFAFAQLLRFLSADDLVNAYGKEYFALFPNFFLFGSPATPFSHCVMPISAERSRGVVRLYWVGADQCASQRFAREYSMAVTREVHAEDRAVIEAAQRGLSSGALDHIHFQSQEVLCRHLFHSVDTMVREWQAGRSAARALA